MNCTGNCLTSRMGGRKMPYDSVSEVLDSQDASISVASPDQFIDLMKECEEYGWHWGDNTKPTYFITAARKLIYPAKNPLFENQRIRI